MDIRNSTYKNNNIFETIQHIIGLFIAILFLISLIPFTYNDIYQLIIGLILIQIIFSILRLRAINLFLEVILLILALIAVLPLIISIKIIAIPVSIIVYIFKMIAAFIAFLDLSAQKNQVIFSNIKYNNTKRGGKQPRKIKKIKNKNFQDAEFKEK